MDRLESLGREPVTAVNGIGRGHRQAREVCELATE